MADKIGIMGSGALGSYVAAFLANSLCGPSINVLNTLLGFMLCLFPALLCFVGSFLLSSSDKTLCVDGDAIEIFNSTPGAASLIASKRKS